MDAVIKICEPHRQEVWDKAAGFGLSKKRPLKLQFVGFESYGDCPMCGSAGFAFQLDWSRSIPVVKIIRQSAPAKQIHSESQADRQLSR